MVDYSSLENYRTERYRGFESLSLRNIKRAFKSQGLKARLFYRHNTAVSYIPDRSTVFVIPGKTVSRTLPLPLISTSE